MSRSRSAALRSIMHMSSVGRADILDVAGRLDPTRLIRSGRLMSHRLFPVFGYIASRLARSAPLSGKYRGVEEAKTPAGTALAVRTLG
jgi:hypothetical protein